MRKIGEYMIVGPHRSETLPEGVCDVREWISETRSQFVCAVLDKAGAERIIDALTAARRALEAEAEVGRLRAALKRYGVHERYICELEENCSCGLDAAQAAEDARAGEGT